MVPRAVSGQSKENKSLSQGAMPWAFEQKLQVARVAPSNLRWLDEGYRARFGGFRAALER